MSSSHLSEKILVMIVGPTAIGKSTLMNEVVRLDDRFARTRSFTTRPARVNDEPGHYFYLTDEDLATRRNDDTIITDVVYPTTGQHYGTILESYSREYNLLDTLAHSVDEYRELPFKKTVTISLTTDPSAWKTWLDARFPSGGEDMRQRLGEALLSIEWSLAQTRDHHWLVNRDQDLTQTAKRLIAIATGVADATAQPPQAAELHTTAKVLLS